MRANEAAERLREQITAHRRDDKGCLVLVDAALAAERRATVERIRAELGSVGAMEGTAELVQRILDDEAAR